MKRMCATVSIVAVFLKSNDGKDHAIWQGKKYDTCSFVFCNY